MIHAYIFVKYGGTLHRDGHGPDFQAVMKRINSAAGTTITIYHTFHAEVRACRTHVWRCQGGCREMAPFYGWCRRAMNRAPSQADWWWAQHQSRCGGTFVKVSEPEGFKEKQAKKRPAPNPITVYFKSLGGGMKLGDSSSQPKERKKKKIKVISPKKEPQPSYFDAIKGGGQKLGSDIEIISESTAIEIIPNGAAIDLTLDD